MFGDGINCIGTELNFNRFTDYVHDSESNLEHSLFRQYSSTQGRYLIPDPYSGSMDLGNPQSMNRYPYVMDNPINYTDPSGLLISKVCLLDENGNDAGYCHNLLALKYQKRQPAMFRGLELYWGPRVLIFQ